MDTIAKDKQVIITQTNPSHLYLHGENNYIKFFVNTNGIVKKV